MARKTSKPTDIVTLADLAPRRPVVGGSERRVFGADAVRPAEENNMAPSKKATKDLPSAKTVKGGRVAYNDNVTLVRVAKPAKNFTGK